MQISGTKQALQDKQQPGRRPIVRAPENVEHTRTTGVMPIILQDNMFSHSICKEEACPELLHANLKYYPYKMQVVQQLSDADKVISQMHHPDSVMCNGQQGHLT
jgi:hypothetical protein